MSYNIRCCLVGREGAILESISFKELCEWLTTNKYNLFGYTISHYSSSWPADYFMRYKTELPL